MASKLEKMTLNILFWICGIHIPYFASLIVTWYFDRLILDTLCILIFLIVRLVLYIFVRKFMAILVYIFEMGVM